MDPYSSMDPYHLQRLRDEVIYLHNLWHQGPPRPPHSHHPFPNPNPNFTPVPNPIPRPHHHHHHPNTSTFLRPTNPTQFKKKDKKKAQNWKNIKNNPKAVSDVEWPCNPIGETSNATSSGWPELKLPPKPTVRLPSAEEQAKFAANHLQQKALKAAQAFLAGNVDSDNDGSEDEEDDVMDDDGSEEYKFFVKVFMEDWELRSYFEKNWETGEFCCLVCEAVGKKVGKRFKNCVALVQHSAAIAKTKKKRAHRGFGQAICKVLGWDIDRLPSIVPKPVEPQVTEKPVEPQGKADDGNKETADVPIINLSLVTVDNAEAVWEVDSYATDVVPDKAFELSNRVDGVMMISEGKSDDGNKEALNAPRVDLASVNIDKVEVSYKVDSEMMVYESTSSREIAGQIVNHVNTLTQGNPEGTVNTLESLNEDGVGTGGNELESCKWAKGRCQPCKS